MSRERDHDPSELGPGMSARLLDVGDQPASLEDRDGARRLRDAEGDRVGGHGDGGGGLVAGAQALGQGLFELAVRGEVAARARGSRRRPG